MTAARLGYRTNQRETIERLTQENTQLRQEIELLKSRLRALGEKI
jgi:cell division protein FtsB